MDPTNPLSVAPPRYKYHPNPETITYFPTYRSESDTEQTDDEPEQEGQLGQEDSDEGSDFSDEEDRLPDVKGVNDRPANYDQSCVQLKWRKGQEEALTGTTQVLIAVNQVAVVLSQALGGYSKANTGVKASLQKIGHVTLRKPNTSGSSSSKKTMRKIFALWSISTDSSSPPTLLAVQVSKVSDRAVHFVSKALVEAITTAAGTSNGKVEILDTYIPQTYVPASAPISQLYLDFPPVRYLTTKKSASVSKEAQPHVIGSRGLEKYESPNYVIGLGAGLLSCLAPTSLNSVLLLVPKPVDGQTIIQAIKVGSDFQSTADALRVVLQGADLDWEDINYASGAGGITRKGRGNGQQRSKKQYGTIGDGGMYV